MKIKAVAIKISADRYDKIREISIVERRTMKSVLDRAIDNYLKSKKIKEE